MRQSLTPIREKLEHTSRNLTPCLKFIFEGSACLVTTCLKSFLAPVPYFFYLCASQEKSHCSCYLHSNIEISTELNLSGHKFSPQIGGDGKLIKNPDVWDITDYGVMDENLYVQEGE